MGRADQRVFNPQRRIMNRLSDVTLAAPMNPVSEKNVGGTRGKQGSMWCFTNCAKERCAIRLVALEAQISNSIHLASYR
jgi:hypothetical protein